MDKYLFRSKIKHHLLDLIKIIKEEKSSEKDSLFSSFSEGKGEFKIFTYKGLKILKAYLSSIFDFPNLVNKFSGEFLKSNLLGLYYESIAPKRDLDLLIDEFFNRLISSPEEEWIVISELFNILIPSKKSYDILESTIKILEFEDINLFSAFKKQICEELMGKTIIYTKVFAGDLEKAKEKALENFEITLNLLRIFNFPKTYLKGMEIDRKLDCYVHNIKKSSSSISKSRLDIKHLINKSKLNEDFYDYLIDTGIDFILKKTSLGKSLMQSLFWFGRGLDEQNLAPKLLNFVTVLESLLKKQGEKTEVKFKLAERGAMLLSNNYFERIKIRNNIKEIYDKRSGIIHKGILIGDKNIVNLVEEYAKEIIIKTIQENKNIGGDMDKFIDNLDNKRML